MDLTVLYKLSYGLYVVGAFKDGRPVGCVINTCFQITSDYPRVAISLNKNNYTLEAIRENKLFSVSILAENSDPSVIGRFGFMSSRDTDKYEQWGYDIIGYTPCVKGVFAGRMILEKEQTVDCGTHVLVIARLVDTVQGEGTPMTYAYYHNVIKGKEPKNAPTYRGEEKAQEQLKKHRFECDVCHYIAETDDAELPEDYVCPICGVDRTHFVEIFD